MESINESLNTNASLNLANDKKLKFENFKNFFANRISFILENKGSSLVYVAALATAITATTQLSKNDNNSLNIPPNLNESNIIFKEENQVNISTRNLGEVDVETGKILINEEKILEQANEYHLDADILKNAIIQNEIWSLEFIEYLPEENYNTNTSEYSYRHLGEVLGDLKTIEYLVEQQQLSKKDKIASQRIFNELLRNKQNIKYGSLDNTNDRGVYNLIHDAAEYNYEFITWQPYKSESMITVTEMIDNWDYDENMLIQYAEELKRFIEIDAWFDMNTYQEYLSSQWKTQLVAHNRHIEKREGY